MDKKDYSESKSDASKGVAALLTLSDGHSSIKVVISIKLAEKAGMPDVKSKSVIKVRAKDLLPSKANERVLLQLRKMFELVTTVKKIIG